uniref:Small G protein signaling modulator 2 n=1 Tax=Nomascus leucogenys TaxID=61853 RepID=A0A2I3HYB3_NOMLE
MGSAGDAVKEKLLWNVKKEVKQIMEEAVTRKFVHEDSSHIIALCGAVEACLLHQLRRRAAGFLRSDKMAALFTKVGKTCPVAGEICHKVQELQQQAEGRKPSGVSQEALRRQGSASGKAPALSPQALKHIWVRTALIEKVLDKVVQYLAENCSKYYEKEALLADPVFGPILASLLVGPCALEYTKLKTADHYWTDPSADELVQRHRIRGLPTRQDSPAKRPALGIRKRHSSGSASEDRLAACARECVESLHQNSRTRLLYGKNHVLVQPKEDMEAVPGYLSLHQSAESLTLKWTPNQLMNGTLGDSELEKSVYWDYALVVPFSQVVCIHCHQQKSGGTLVLVSQDGIQRPPLHFPQGGHLLSFLSCLENGLLPRGQLELPLWTQQGKYSGGRLWGKGCVFPKLRKRSSIRSVDMEEMGTGRTTDYVFRIIYPGHRHEHNAGDMIEMQGFGPSLPAWHLEPLCSQGFSCLSCSSSSSPRATPSHCSCIPDRCSLLPLLRLSFINPDDPPVDCGGGTVLTPRVPQNYKELELLRRVYYGGIEHEIRKDVWPFLLGHYKFGMSKKEMEQVDAVVAARYQQVLAEWKACEVVVRQREREAHPATRTKFSSGSSIDSHVQRLIHRDSTISNDVSQTGPGGLGVSGATHVLCTMVLSTNLKASNRHYVWEHLEVGYVQGMCDLLAPLLVTLDNDQLAYSCFSHLMKRMSQNFPNGGAMDTHFSNMRSLIQILDSELFELMHQNGDYTHFYFCYRWFLLDFKRELLYEDVFAVWEVIWAARHISSEHFVLFIALALVEAYREIICDNNMDFTDIIKFFNERAEHHDAQEILRIARDLVHKVQMLIENK